MLVLRRRLGRRFRRCRESGCLFVDVELMKRRTLPRCRVDGLERVKAVSILGDH